MRRSRAHMEMVQIIMLSPIFFSLSLSCSLSFALLPYSKRKTLDPFCKAFSEVCTQ